MNRNQRNSSRRPGGWLRRQLEMKPKPLWVLVVADVVLLGVSLVVFALFHHVLPRHEQAVGLVSSREAASGAALAGNALDEDGGNDAQVDLSALASDGIAFGADATQAPAAEATAEPAAEAQPVGALVGDFTSYVPGDFSEKYADKFTDGKVIKSESGYQSQNLNITLNRYHSDSATFYVADIYVRDISCIVSAFAKDTFGRGLQEATKSINARIGGVIAVNGDYYGAREDGVVIRNGELYREDKYPDRDVCVLYWDGTMETYNAGQFDARAAINNGAYQAWNFGPRLLDSNGKAKSRFNSDVAKPNPRTALGYFEPGHYCFVVVDGRQDDSVGMTLQELSALMAELGCASAFNMDGGNSSVMVVGDKVVNNPSGGGRATSDIIAIVDM